MMAAPLILGNDIRDFIKSDGTVDTDNRTYQIITNKELISVDQDELGVQCKRIRTNGAEDVLVKPLANGEFALCFFNKASSVTTMNCSVNEIVGKSFVTTSYSGNYSYRELWSGEEGTTSDIIETQVNGHGVKVFRVRSV
jgi:alpha-galactosidase